MFRERGILGAVVAAPQLCRVAGPGVGLSAVGERENGLLQNGQREQIQSKEGTGKEKTSAGGHGADPQLQSLSRSQNPA